MLRWMCGPNQGAKEADFAFWRLVAAYEEVERLCDVQAFLLLYRDEKAAKDPTRIPRYMKEKARLNQLTIVKRCSVAFQCGTCLRWEGVVV